MLADYSRLHSQPVSLEHDLRCWRQQRLQHPVSGFAPDPDLGSVPRFGNQLINTPKLDYQLSQKHHISLLYHRLRWDSPGGVQTQGTNNYAIDTFGQDFVKLDYGVAKLDSLITNSITNELALPVRTRTER